jgi:hypothetical protein
VLEYIFCRETDNGGRHSASPVFLPRPHGYYLPDIAGALPYTRCGTQLTVQKNAAIIVSLITKLPEFFQGPAMILIPAKRLDKDFMIIFDYPPDSPEIGRAY